MERSGEETCGYHASHGIFLVEGGSVRLDSAGMDQIYAIFEKYLGLYGVSTVAKIQGEPLSGRQRLSQENVQLVVGIMKRWNDDKMWQQAPAEYTAEIELIIENTGFYYDTVLGLIGKDGNVFPLNQEEQAEMNTFLARYVTI